MVCNADKGTTTAAGCIATTMRAFTAAPGRHRPSSLRTLARATVLWLAVAVPGSTQLEFSVLASRKGLSLPAQSTLVWQTDGSGYRASVGAGIHVKTPFSPMPIRIYGIIPLNDKENDNTEFLQFSFGAQF